MACNRDCAFGGECTCRPDAHDAELRRIDAQARARRADAIRAETNAAMDSIIPPDWLGRALDDRMDGDELTAAGVER